MKVLRSIIAVVCLLAFTGLISQLYSQINVITYNIRYNNTSDGEHAWPHRKDNVINLLKFHEADVFCLQEALHQQVMQVDSAFKDFTFTGVGRDDGKQAGEYSPVFYRSTMFHARRSGNFWLAEDPSFPALGWDAVCIRICTWAELKDNNTGKIFFVFNTHFDHVGKLARKNAAELISKKIVEIAGDSPVILCGDFNLPPESEPIGLIKGLLNDSHDVTLLPPNGPEETRLGFTYDGSKGRRIDYIFVSDDVKVKKYAVLADSRNRSFFSDHLPVFVELEMGN